MLHVKLMPPVLAGSGNDIAHPDALAAAKELRAACTGKGDRPALALTALESIVIAMAHHDTRASLRPRGRLSRLLFGAGSSFALADPCLEALRRYAILYRLESVDIMPAERERLAAAGYDDRQRSAIEALVRSAPLGRGRSDRFTPHQS